MAALELGERVPMPIEQTREDFRFYFALLEFFVTLFVARVVFAIGINRRHEHDDFSVRGPDRAIGTGRDRRSLPRFPNQRSVRGVEIGSPDLRRIARFPISD